MRQLRDVSGTILTFSIFITTRFKRLDIWHAFCHVSRYIKPSNMIALLILLSFITFFSLWKLYTKRRTIDDSKVLANRLELMDLAVDDWQHGRIDKNLFRALSFVFHPDFKNLWDYVPPERQDYTRQMYILDSNFWNYYKISPDYLIPSNMVYELYKEFISKHQHNSCPHHCSK